MKKTLLTLSLMTAAVPATMLAAPSTAHAGDEAGITLDDDGRLHAGLGR